MTPQEFGELIRAHREAKGFSIEELALRFKLSVHTVRGIEEGVLDNMPHVVYAKGFVRAYAQAVDVPPEDLGAGLAVLFPEEETEDIPAAPGPVGRSASRSERPGRLGGILAAVLVLLLLIGGGLYAFSQIDTLKDFTSRTVSFFSGTTDPSSVDDPGARSPATENGASSSISTPAASVNAPTEPAPAPETQGTEPAPTPSADRDAALATPAVPPVTPEPEQTVPPQTVPVAPAPSVAADEVEPLPVEGKQVGIEATEECWVQVSVDGGGSRTFTVYPGETSVLPYKNRLTLVLGNAGGVSLTHNGKPFTIDARRNEKRTLSFQ
ncbi:MAG: DUF4115 domain-containing protein [Deltaproteobacteria bacterium]|nr:DUF4115 domain-containing protein [Deltaproteobacteria bacterium]